LVKTFLRQSSPITAQKQRTGNYRPILDGERRGDDEPTSINDRQPLGEAAAGRTPYYFTGQL
jgi:hypothetical protein